MIKLCKSLDSDWSLPGIFIYKDSSGREWWWYYGLWNLMSYPSLVPTERSSPLEFLLVTGHVFKEPNEENKRQAIQI